MANSEQAIKSTPAVLYVDKHTGTITELSSDVRDCRRVYDIHPRSQHKHLRIFNATVNGNKLGLLGTGLHGEDLDNQILSVITSAEPVTNEHAKGVFKIGDELCKDFAIIGTRLECEGDVTMQGTTLADISLSKIKNPEDVRKYIELEPRITDIIEATSSRVFDKEILKTFVRYIFTIAERECVESLHSECLRFRSVDRSGEVVAQKNYGHFQKQELYRWVCNSYDEFLNVEFDWNLRAPTPRGSNKETKPVKKLARPTDNKSKFVLHLPDGSQGFKVYEDSKFTQRDKVIWQPVAGIPVRTESESKLVTFDFGEV